MLSDYIRPSRAFFVFAVALTLVLAMAPRAGAAVYWSQGFAIGRANLDGSDLLIPWIPPRTHSTCGVAVDGSHIYWSEGGSIGRANLNGTNPNDNFISTPNNSCGIAVDGSHIYWANKTAIGRANLDGSGNNPSFIPSAAFFISSIAVDSSHIYWSDGAGERIGRADLNGANLKPSFIKAPGDPCAVAVNSSRIYWSSAEAPGGPAGVFSEGLTGNPRKVALVTGTVGCGVAVNAQYLYWAGFKVMASGGIGRAKLDGSSPDPSFIGGYASADGIALDSHTIPPFLTLGNLNINKLLGTAKLRVHVGLAGRLGLKGNGIRSVARFEHAAGTVSLPVVPMGAAKHELRKTGKVKVGLTVTFTPKGGAPQIKHRKLTLRKR